MQKTIYIIIAVIIIALVGWYFMTQTQTQNTNETAQQTQTQNTQNNDTNTDANTQTPPSSQQITATFTNTDGESVTVIFDNAADTAVLTGAGYTDLILPHARSADGARYKDPDSGVVVWNVGNEVTITKDGEKVFEGTQSTSSLPMVQ